MGERVWMEALTDVEVMTALIAYAERERKISLPIAADETYGLAMHRENGRFAVVIYAEKKDPPRERKPFRWPWQKVPAPSIQEGTK